MPPIGIHTLPPQILNSPILSPEQLEKLAAVEALPEPEPSFFDRHVREIVHYFSPNPDEMELELHRYAAWLLDEGRVREAWQVLLTAWDQTP